VIEGATMPLSDNVPIVLLVHRNDDSLAIYQEFLAHKGFVPRAVSDGHEALSSARAVDIIITEIILDGDMDGFELISRLRRDGSTKHKPIVVLTSSAWNTERQRAETAGCDLFLTKPCLPDELVREVRRLLASKSRAEARPRSAKATLPIKTATRRNRRGR